MPIPYNQYIVSLEWLERAKLIKKRDDHCLACFSTTRLHCHHGSYDRLGRELDSDLFTLCWWCHDRLHAAFKVKTVTVDLLTFTREYIRKKAEATNRSMDDRGKSTKRVNVFDDFLMGMAAGRDPLRRPALPATEHLWQRKYTAKQAARKAAREARSDRKRKERERRRREKKLFKRWGLR